MSSLTSSPDISRAVRELASSMEQGPLNIAMQTVFGSHPSEHAAHPELASMPVDVFLESFGDSLAENSSSLEDLETAIVIYSEVVRLRPEGHARHAVSLIDLGASLQRSCAEGCLDVERLNLAIALLRRAVELCLPGDPAQLRGLLKLSDVLFSLFEQSGTFEVLLERIGVCRVLLSLHQPEDSARFIAIGGLASALLLCFEHQGDVNKLTEAVDLSRQALELCPLRHTDRSSSLNNLACSLQIQFTELGDLGLLAEAIDLYRQALNLRLPGHPERSSSLKNLAAALEIQFGQLGNNVMLTEMVDLHRQGLGLCPLGHPDRSSSLNRLATALKTQFEQLGDLDSLVEAVDLHRQSLDLRLPGHPDRFISLNNLATALTTQFEQLGSLDSLTEAIDLHRQALSLHPLGHPGRSISLNNLANALNRRFLQLGDLDSLTEAADLHREALDLRPLGHPDRFVTLNNLASAMSVRFEQFGELDSLTEVVNLHRQALDLHPLGHSDRSISLNNLASALATQFEQLGDWELLAEAIGLYRQALYLHPLGHPDRSISLNNLASAMSIRFEQLGDFESLAEAIDLNRRALDLRPPGHPDRFTSLSKLATTLETRFEQLGDLTSLAEAVELHRQALDLHPLGHPARPMSLNNLATALATQFEQVGKLSLLVEAVDLHRQALHLCPLRQPVRSSLLNNLAAALHTRFEQLGDLDSLTEAVDLHRQSLSLHPLGHPQRSTSLENLAITLKAHSEQFNKSELLSEAIGLHRQALDLHPLGHPARPISLNNLATALATQSEKTGNLDSLIEAIELHRQALDLHALGHPSRFISLRKLATALETRFDQLRDLNSLIEAVHLHRQALDLCLSGHPFRSDLLFSLARCMLRKGTRIFDFTNGIQHIFEALQDGIAPARTRLHLVIPVLRAVEAAYQSVPVGIRHDHDDMVLQAYISAIRLLPQAASLGYDHTGRLRELSGAETLSRIAATRAITMKREEDAVEILEEGRGVFWAQALRLRGTELDLLPRDDAQELRWLLQILEAGSVRDETLTSAQQEREAEKRRLHSETAEAIVASIRSRPGLERFLMPPAFASIVQSIPKGFVVLLNVSELGYHALIMDGCARSVSSVSLNLPARIVGSKRNEVQHNLSRGANTVESEVSDDEPFAIGEKEEGARASGVRERVIRTFEDSLADLWIFVVRPVIAAVQLNRSYGRDRPRVWWCPTGSLTFRPIHAAGCYTQAASERLGVSNECASDYMISSYTPSILSLVRARSGSISLPRNEIKGIVVHEGKPLRGMKTLSKVRDEVRCVKERFEAAGAIVTVVNDTSTHPTVPGVLTCLQSSDVNVLHLSCHGVQYSNPLASAFILRDGDLTIQQLMQLDMKHALLTFLSACQTAKGHEHLPDQAVHLAASMLFCGFKGVIATMWSMADADGPVVASSVYETLFKEAIFDLSDVPYALDDAIRLLRERKVDAERWAVFVHMGA